MASDTSFWTRDSVVKPHKSDEEGARVVGSLYLGVSFNWINATATDVNLGPKRPVPKNVECPLLLVGVDKTPSVSEAVKTKLKSGSTNTTARSVNRGPITATPEGFAVESSKSN